MSFDLADPYVVAGIAFAFALSHLLWAHLGHYLGYRRGYLTAGYFAGLLLGPLGALIAAALPSLPDPILQLEWTLNYRTDDSHVGHWFEAVVYTFVSIVFLAVGTLTFMHSERELSAALLFLGLAPLMAGIGWWYARKAQPPTFLLPPLPQHAQPGMQDLLHWIGARHYAARLEQQVQLMTGLRGAAALLLLAGIGGSIAGALNDAGPVWIIAGGAVAVVSLAAALLLGPRIRGARYRTGALYRELFPMAPGTDKSHASPRELAGKIEAQYRRILTHSFGHSKSRAESLAVATVEVAEHTRRSFFTQPVGVLILLWFLFKSCKAARLVTRWQEGALLPAAHGPQWIALALFALVVWFAIAGAWVWQAYRRNVA